MTIRKFKIGNEVIFYNEEKGYEQIGTVEKIYTNREYGIRVYQKHDIYGDLCIGHENDMKICFL